MSYNLTDFDGWTFRAHAITFVNRDGNERKKFSGTFSCLEFGCPGCDDWLDRLRYNRIGEIMDKLMDKL